VHPGFRADHVLTMQISLPATRYSGLRAELFYKQLLDRVNTLPGVQDAGLCRFLPLSGNDASVNFLIEGQPALASADQPRAKFRAAGGAYFAALRIPLLKGRLFDASDNERTPKVVVINETAARQYWPNEDPVGKRILSGLDKNQWSTIIGVIGNVKHAGLDAETNPETYYHFLQIPPEAVPLAEATMALVLRTSTAPEAMISAVRGAVSGLDPEQPVYDVRTMEEVRDGSVAQPRFRTVLLGIFASLAVLLAAIGLYCVMAYSVTQRTNELGVRMALGAEPSYILRLVLGKGLMLTAIGLVVGLALAVGCARIIAGFLFDVRTTDFVTFGVSSLLVLSVAAMASVVPALRATRVDPVSALRTE
jgi:putative ABC transport system permease protein